MFVASLPLFLAFQKSCVIISLICTWQVSCQVSYGGNILKLKPLKIGDLTAEVPIVQGGMGVGISLSGLAGAVAREGGVGVISAAHPGYKEPDFKQNTLAANKRALEYHIKRAKEISGGKGLIGVNIMCVSRDYDEYVRCAAQCGADIIISGAGLPVKLPELLKDCRTMFAPIVSPLRSVQALFKVWDRRYHTMPHLVVIEGPPAGGHLGYDKEYLLKSDYTDYEAEVSRIIEYVKDFANRYGVEIPVVYGGGVYDRNDIDRCMALGADGVQMATRFVATEECDAHPAFKQAYVQASASDITITDSPVGMPGRAIANSFVKERALSREDIRACFNCMEMCNPAKAPYCITAALIRAVKGDTENSLIFCGTNAAKITGISTVKEIISELNA